MTNEVYTDLENSFLKEKHETLRMEFIEMLVKKYPNDYDLGGEVRKFVNIKKNTKEEFKL
jgi:hypothetical protein